MTYLFKRKHRKREYIALHELAYQVDEILRRRFKLTVPGEHVTACVKALAAFMSDGNEGRTFLTLMRYAIEREAVLRRREYQRRLREEARAERERDKAIEREIREKRHGEKRKRITAGVAEWKRKRLAEFIGHYGDS